MMEETNDTINKSGLNEQRQVSDHEGSLSETINKGRKTSKHQKVAGQKQRDENMNFDTKIIDIRRVSKMNKGGRTMRFSVFVTVGDKNGMVGLGIGKGEDIKQAQDKAVLSAKKNMIKINLKGNTIPHSVNYKYKAARVFLKPAVAGTGIVAGSSVRLIAEVAGIQDMLSKILGTNNKITNAYAVLNALASMKN